MVEYIGGVDAIAVSFLPMGGDERHAARAERPAMDILSSRLLFSQSLACVATVSLLSAISCVSGHPSWIHVGTTTKAEVIERYGDPDLVRVSPEGEIATYRPASRQPSPPLEVPVAQAGPSGLTTTTLQPINRGLGVKNVAAGVEERPRQEIHIRYDREGIVREVRQ